MGRLTLVARLVARDLRHRPSEAVLLLLAITAAATTLTLGLVLHGVTSGPYQRTRAVTAGPDVVASVFSNAPATGRPADRSELLPLEKAGGVTGYGGPYPVTFAALHGGGYAVPAMVEGRDETQAAVDRPLLTAGSWVRPGTVVLERSFASALGIGVNTTITLNERVFHVSGIAVSAAVPPYPAVCSMGCQIGPSLPGGQPGLIWTTQADATSLASLTRPVAWFLNLRLTDPASAAGYAAAYNQATASAPSAPYLTPWQDIATQAGRIVQAEQQILLTSSWLIGLLAVASVSVLAGGRMAGQVRRVGLLKAVGATPGLVGVVLLAEHVLLALAAAGLGLALGWLAAPPLSSPGAGLLGSAGPPSLTPRVAALVVAVALGVAVVATVAPAIRGARISTVAALTELTRPPKRRPVVTRVSARMPVVLLLGMRIAARRPRRSLLSAAGVLVTVAGLVAALTVQTRLNGGFGSGGELANPLNERAGQVLMVAVVALVVLSAVNALLITWATVLDARRSAALTRALGASPGQVSAGLAVAQMLPALAGAVAGVPAGLALYAAVKSGGVMSYPPAWWLAVVVIATPLVVGALTMAPSRLAARADVAPVLHAEAA